MKYFSRFPYVLKIYHKCIHDGLLKEALNEVLLNFQVTE